MSADEGGLGAERLRKWRDVAEATAATANAPKVTGDDPPGDWIYDSAAVRPTEHDDEGEKR